MADVNSRFPPLGRLLGRVFQVLCMRELPVPLDFGDLVTTCAVKT